MCPDIECRAFDPVDQLARYVRWWREGHLRELIIGCMLVEDGHSADEALHRVHELTRAIQHKPC